MSFSIFGMFHQRQKYYVLCKLLFGSLLYFFNSAVFAETPYILTDNSKAQPMGRFVSYLEDKDSSLTIAQATDPRLANQFVLSTQNEIKLGRTHSSYWLKVKLANPFSNERRILLEIVNSNLANLSLYHQVDSGWQVKQDGQNLTVQRDMRHRYPVFSLNIPAKTTQTYFLHVPPQGVSNLPLLLWHPDDFVEQYFELSYVSGIYYGMLLVLMLYSLFSLFFLKERIYLLYVGLIITFTLVIGSFDGVVQRYLTDADILNTYVNCYYLALLAFTRYFLHTDQHFPRLDWLIIGLMIICPLNVVVWWFSTIYVLLDRITALAVFITIFITSLWAWWQGMKRARYLVLAWLAMLIAGVLAVLVLMGNLPTTGTMDVTRFGTILSILLLSFALDDRITISRMQSVLANEQQLKEAEEKQRLLSEQLRLKEKHAYMDAEISIAQQMQQVLRARLTEFQKSKTLDMAGFTRANNGLDTEYFKILKYESRTIVCMCAIKGTQQGINHELTILMSQAALQTLAIAGFKGDRMFQQLQETLLGNMARIQQAPPSLMLLDSVDGNITLHGEFATVLFMSTAGECVLVDVERCGENQPQRLHSGEGFVIYTSGITDVCNPQQQPYGAKRLQQMLAANWHLDAESIKTKIDEDIAQYRHGHATETTMTLFVMKVPPLT